MKKLTFPTILILSFLLFFSSEIKSQSLSPEQVAQKTAALVSGNKDVSATFTIKGNGRSGKGTIKSSGTKFSVSLPDVSIWYNGKDLYTYNSRTQETTLVNPTAQELIESNPLLYVKGGGANYNYSFSSVKRSGKYNVELTPKKSKNNIEQLSFTINSSNFYPEKILVSTSGGLITIDIDSFNPNASFSSSEFEYPKNKFPKAEIIDLR